ncbi:unnamed protein product [Mytilus edulis]|uniref:Endonuclease/exonuclease/phosphatase domain-containing protein n=1 Tax=Mytilus edulis TaxID=6550 RepID=A0A8S3UM36_MYTED|nr:unnamed protein product [Mytilus edulis]
MNIYRPTENHGFRPTQRHTSSTSRHVNNRREVKDYHDYGRNINQQNSTASYVTNNWDIERISNQTMEPHLITPPAYIQGSSHYRQPSSFPQQNFMPWLPPSNFQPPLLPWQNPWQWPPFGQDIYLAAVYVSPENSSCNVPDLNSVYAHLLSDIEKYCKLGDIMVQGDFNAHTNTSPDYVLFDESKQPYVVDNYYVEDSIMPRNNLDPKRINNSGRCLLDLCKETSLTILNGRTIGDLHGKQSCITYNGCSLVDYTLVSFDLLSLVGYFEIHDLTSLSNHCPISCTLVTFFRSTNFVNQTQLDPLPGKFIWSPGAIESYVKDITSKENKTKLALFTNNSFKSSDSAVQSLTSILYESAKKSAKLVYKMPHRKIIKS